MPDFDILIYWHNIIIYFLTNKIFCRIANIWNLKVQNKFSLFKVQSVCRNSSMKEGLKNSWVNWNPHLSINRIKYKKQSDNSSDKCPKLTVDKSLDVRHDVTSIL